MPGAEAGWRCRGGLGLIIEVILKAVDMGETVVDFKWNICSCGKSKEIAFFRRQVNGSCARLSSTKVLERQKRQGKW